MRFIRITFCVLLLSVSMSVTLASTTTTKRLKYISCKRQPMLCRIVKLRPDVSKKWAKRFAHLLVLYGRKYHMDPWRSLAIAMQESSLKNVHRKHAVMLFYKKCYKKNYKKQCREKYRIVNGFSDLSIFQFHTRTIEHYHMNPIRLKYNLAYAVREHYKLLKIKEKKCEDLGKLSWTCYHSRTPELREHYAKLVNRYYYGKRV